MKSDCSFLVLAAATAAALTVATSNAFFAYDLGALIPVTVAGVSLFADGLALAAASAAVAVFEARAATLALRPRPGDSRLVASFFLILCLCYSIGAMASHVMKLQRLQESARLETGRERQLAEDALRDAEKIRTDIANELAGLAEVRTPGEIEAALAAVEIPSRTLRKSDNCTAAWARTADDCRPILELRAELARAERKAELTPRLDAAIKKVDGARTSLANIKSPAAPSAPEEFLAFYVAWTLALVIQACASFGFALAFRTRAPTKLAAVPAPPAPAAVPPVPAPVAVPMRSPRGRAHVDLLDVLQKVHDGGLHIQGATVDAGGWIQISQAALAGALGTSKTTVCKKLADLETAGRLHKKVDGKGTALKIIYPPISAVNQTP